MTPVRAWLQKGLAVLVALLMIPVLLSLFLVAAVLSRPLIVIAIFVTVVGLLIYAASPAFRRWLETRIAMDELYKGIRLASGVLLHPAHSWARILPRGVVVGADDLVQAAIGPIDAVDLPTAGQRIHEGERLFTLRRGGRSLDILAPITGTVLARNDSLFSHPGLVNDEPFGGGWAVRLRPENLAEAERRLLRGPHARDWLGREIDRFLQCIHGDACATASLADGGVVVNDLYRQIDDRAWQKLRESFFANQTTAGSPS
jgi:glycine cleavage system H lipoate-binding protein